ncbi:hypothetical protein KKI95_02435, partial [Xenorhabdus bovienii]|uniref:hypothetical protein n=1 Tax=Xenorhabdus bovienii TaxID=40576 RepID=UPI0023B318E5
FPCHILVTPHDGTEYQYSNPIEGEVPFIRKGQYPQEPECFLSPADNWLHKKQLHHFLLLALC